VTVEASGATRSSADRDLSLDFALPKRR
jgi:hypothetical protein